MLCFQPSLVSKRFSASRVSRGPVINAMSVYRSCWNAKSRLKIICHWLADPKKETACWILPCTDGMCPCLNHFRRALSHNSTVGKAIVVADS